LSVLPLVRHRDAAATNVPGPMTVLVVDDHREAFYASDFQQGIREAGFRLVMITFRHDVRFAADIVHNQNLLALEHDYGVADHTRLLLGPRYAVLDDAYRHPRSERAGVPERARVVLVTFGGADRTNQSRKVVEALASLEDPPDRVILVVGGLYTHAEELKEYVDGLPDLAVELHVNTSKMPELMAASDLAVSSGGLTAWELACLGVPNIILSTADAERQTGRLLSRRDYAHYLGHHDEAAGADVALPSGTCRSPCGSA
jgi:UDP-2,4-diacetamido-2,4,6-trideoxy-beta-L-altropyranose hydrolase